MKLFLLLRNFLYSLKRKLFLYFGKRKPPPPPPPPQQFLIFQETECYYISGSNSRSPKIKKNTIKKFFLFYEMKFSSPKLKKLLIF